MRDPLTIVLEPWAQALIAIALIALVIWLTVILGQRSLYRAQVGYARQSRDRMRGTVLQREERVYALMQELRDKDALISHLSFELDRIYVAEAVALPPAVPPPAPVSNTDKVIAYAQAHGLNQQ